MTQEIRFNNHHLAKKKTRLIKNVDALVYKPKQFSKDDLDNYQNIYSDRQELWNLTNMKELFQELRRVILTVSNTKYSAFLN